MSEEPLVSAEEVASVLDTGEAETPAEADAGGGSNAYSLRRPVAIAPEAEGLARKRVDKLADSLAEVLQREMETTLGIEVLGFQQQPAGNAVQSMEPPTWVLSFHCGEGGGVSLVLDAACALTVVELALGGPGSSAASGREPTPLESRVMSNLADALAGKLSKLAGVEFGRTTFGVGRVPTGVAAAGETVGGALLKLKFGSTERSGMLLVSAGLLRDETPTDKDAPPKVGPLAPRLERVTVEARPVLRAGRVTLHDLTSLRPGSVLQLEPDQEAELELRTAGQALFRGRVTREGGTAALQVSWRRGGHDEEKKKEPSG